MEESSDSRVMLMNIPSSGTRSVSPMSPTPSPSRELRGVRLFRAISRKLGRRSAEDLSYACEDDCMSSSTDSCSSTSTSVRCPRSKKTQNEGSSCSSGGSGFRSSSPNHTSSSSSESGSETQRTKRHRHHHSTTAASFRRVFQNLTINTRSQSCSSKDTKRRGSKKTTPKRILRPPVTYTYVRGLSGLPTQRVPRTPPRTYTSCGCSGPYVPGLNR